MHYFCNKIIVDYKLMIDKIQFKQIFVHCAIFFLIFFPSLYILPFSPSTCRSHGSEATEMLMSHVVTTTSWLVSLEEEEKSRRTRRRP